MNLADMVEQICQDTGYLDRDDRAFAKTALRQRDDLIYRMGMWKDSLVQVNLTIDPTTNEDHAEGIVYLPEVIERVIAVRTADTPLNVSGLETFYRIPFEVFSQTGILMQFAKLNPGWFTWRGGRGLQLVTAPGDNTIAARVVWRDDAGEQFTSLLKNDGQLLSTSLSTDKKGMIVSGSGTADLNGLLFRKGTYNGKPVYLSGTGTFTAGVFAGDGGQIHWDGTMWQAGVLIAGNFGDYYGSNDAVATPDLVTTWIPQGDPTLPTVTAYLPCRMEIESLFKPKTTGAFALNPILTGDVAGATVAAMATASVRHQRIRLFPIPKEAGGIKVLGKAKYVPLDFDQAEPQVTASHLCLMAFAKHALRKRGGEHGAAGDDLTEAMGLLEVLKKEEMQQEANNQRIIPESGYGDAFFGPGRDGFWVG